MIGPVTDEFRGGKPARLMAARHDADGRRGTARCHPGGKGIAAGSPVGGGIA
jgi:hypothetical protein